MKDTKDIRRRKQIAKWQKPSLISNDFKGKWFKLSTEKIEIGRRKKVKHNIQLDTV